METHSPSRVRNGSIAIFLGAASWGLFWLPMRHFDENGLPALWAVAGINLAAMLVAIPFAFWKGEVRRSNLKWLIIVGLGTGVSNVMYLTGLILSDVIRVTFLFYLLPIWATLFSKLLFNVEIGGKRTIAVMFAFAGIWLLLGGGNWPVPQNIGDVFGLFSGMGWALGLTLMRGKGELGGFASTASSHSFGFISAILLGVILSIYLPSVQPQFPDLDAIADIALPVLAFGIVIFWPSYVGQLWGAKFVIATTAALLTMSEIMVATLSTMLLEGTDMTLISWLGGGLIICAIFIDLAASRDA